MTTAPRARPAPDRCELRMIGSFALLQGGRDITPRGRKACAILAYLAARDGSHVPRERLAALLWGDRGPVQARASLRQSLLEIRHAFEGACPVGADRGHVWLQSEAVQRIGLESGAGNEPLFEDLDHISAEFDDWLALERAHLRRQFVEQELVAIDGMLRDGGDALARIERLEAADPLNEDVLRLRMRAEAATGHSAGVKQAYLAYAERVEREVGVCPSHESQALREALLGELAHGSEGEAPAPDSLLVAAPPAAVPPPRAEPNDDPAPEPLAQAPGARGRSPWSRPAAPAAGLALAALLGLGVLLATAPDAPSGPGALVVMPFAARGVAPAAAEGLSHEVAAALSEQRVARVLGSSAQLVGADGRPQFAAMRTAAGADYVLLGTVERGRQGVVLDSRLVRTRDQSVAWHGRLAAPALTPALEHGLVAAVARTLGAAPAQAGGEVAISAGDFDLYLQSMALIRSRDPAGVAAAERLLARVVARHPQFAPGWAQWGIAHMLASGHEPAERRRAGQALRRALALDPRLGAAHAGLALVAGQGTIAARRHVAQAVQANPDDPQALYWFATEEQAAGQFDRADRALDRALRLDPRWRRPIEARATSLAASGRLDDALALAARLDPDQPAAALGARLMAYNGAGRFADTVAVGMPRLGEAIAGRTGARALAEALAALDLPNPMVAADPLLTRLARGPLPDKAALAAHLARAAQQEQRLLTVRGQDDLLLALLPALLDRGRPDLVIAALEAAGPEPLLPGLPRASDLQSHGPYAIAALRQLGRAREADALLARLEAWSRLAGRQAPRQQEAVQSALAAMLSGDRARALGMLAQADRLGFTALAGVPGSRLGALPLLRPLNGDPRFERLVRRNEQRWRAQRARAERSLTAGR